MNIEEQARQIMNREPVAQVEAFLNAFTESMRAMAQRMPVDSIPVRVAPDAAVLLKTYSKYDGSTGAKQLDKDVQKTRALLARLSAKPEFEGRYHLFRELDLVLLAHQLQRRYDRPHGRPRLRPEELMYLWALDFCLAEELPTVGRSFGPSTRSGQLAEALLGKRPPADIRARLDEFDPSIPTD